MDILMVGILLSLPAWGFAQILMRLHYGDKHSDIVEKAKLQANRHGVNLKEYALKLGIKRISLWFIIPYIIFIFILTSENAIPEWQSFAFVLAVAGGWFFSAENRYIVKLIRIQTATKTQQPHHEAKFNNDGFDYDEGAFNGRGSSAQTNAEDPAPRGFEDRHPNDAKFWAYVDDPAASDGERKKAFDTILKRQAKRQGKTGGNVEKFP